MDMYIQIVVFVFGACVGSFLNVCIVRMPKDLSVVFPGSHCGNCKKPIAWYDNIPLLSYWILGGKCRYCHQKFSIRYFFIELLTAVTFFLFYQYFGLARILIPYLFMVSCFIVATFVDLEHRIIPDQVSVGGLFAGLLFSLLIPQLHLDEIGSLVAGRWIAGIASGLFLILSGVSLFSKKEPFEREDWVALFLILGFLGIDAVLAHGLWGSLPSNHVLWPYLRSLDASIIGVLAGGGLIYCMGVVGDFIFKKESMGGGDIKLLAMIGAFMGWKLAVLTFFLAPFFGAVFGIAEKIRTGESMIAYGPFIVAGALLSLFRGEMIIAWVMGQYGIF